MNSFLPYLILSCMFYKTVVMQVSISADITQIIIGGANVTLTCNLPSFSVPALWVNNITSGTLTVCRNTGICSPQSFGRYIYSASSSTIVAKISEFDNSTDNFGWKCQYSSYSDVFIFNFTNTISSTRDIQNSTTAATTIMKTPTSPTTYNDPVVQSTETTNGSIQSMKTATACLPPDLVIVGVTVSGFLSILVIIFICCCCPFCCLYHSRMKQTTTNDKENDDNVNKTKAGIPIQAQVMTNESNRSSASDKYVSYQSEAL